MKDLEKEKGWYWEVSLECDKNHFELLSYYLFETGATGIQEISDAAGKISIKVFFSSDMSSSEKIERSLYEITESQEIPIQPITIIKKQHQDWTSGWKSHFKPFFIGENFLVRPPWEKPNSDKLEIVIDPGQGFGTGYHPSTVIALMLLEWSSQQTDLGKVLDVGTGSGILTIGAFLLGASSVTAIDNDENVMDEICKNLDISLMHEKRCEIFHTEPKELKSEFDLVLANIENHILLQMMVDLHRLTRQSRFLILSGILFEYRSEFRLGLPTDMQVIKELRIEDWWGCILRKGLIMSE